LREREYWVVRATLTQLQLSIGLALWPSNWAAASRVPGKSASLSLGESRLLRSASWRVDIYSTAKSEKGYVVFGRRF